MKSIIKVSLILLVISLIHFSCKKDKENIAFTFLFEKNFNIGSGLNPFLTHNYVLHDFQSSLNAKLSQSGLSLSDLSSINPQSGILFSLSNNVEFGYIRDISIEARSSDGSIEKEVFYRENIPLNSDAEVTLLPTLVDMKTIFNDETFDIIVKLTLRDISPYSVDAKLRMEFNALR